MMTNASAALERAHGFAAIVALVAGIAGSLVAIGFMVTSPATIPMWCAAHGGCP